MIHKITFLKKYKSGMHNLIERTRKINLILLLQCYSSDMNQDYWLENY